MTTKKAPGTLGSVLDELKSGTFLGNARARASRRKSPWNLLLILVLPLWLVLWWSGVQLAIFTQSTLLHGAAVPETWLLANSFAPFLLYFPLLISTPLPAAVLVNYAIYGLVTPARRAMDAEDRAFPGTEYATAQPQLVRLTLRVLPFAFALAVLGAICR